MFFSVVCVVILVVVAHICTGCRRDVWCFLISHSQADLPLHLCIIQRNGELNVCERFQAERQSKAGFNHTLCLYANEDCNYSVFMNPVHHSCELRWWVVLGGVVGVAVLLIWVWLCDEVM